ncbi:YhgE/Pip domain-containing protein [Clostridium weizhouense]|uniref:YhgE/Pip domain-containing protein n=1 Tax=Clostridium weizhouense TaxID=2859781 RepID=A0ABS7ASB7_9CLOT|nr:YhgE/Pip domain-containing protein [Clostridium weizhouense]MBW6410536.1 YhgE/Pip domain-containing protein [Clostridium weizhouense]
MKNIFEIYKKDISSIFKNYAALIVVIALCMLPSLYAWFNIMASWDPYAPQATSQIKIGVVNKDIGASLNGDDINLGNKIIEELKNNDLMGWQFVSEDEASDALQKGKYYASITIPEEFSSQMTSIITSEIKKGDIIYTVNEKINAIAPKLTNKGATGVQENISKSLIETVSKTLLTVSKELGLELEEQLPTISRIYNMLNEIRGKFSEINNTVNLAYNGAIKIRDLSNKVKNDIPLIQNTLINAKDLTSEVGDFITSSKEELSRLSPTIKEDIRIINEISKEVLQDTDTIIGAINSGSKNALDMVNNLINRVDILDKTTKSLIKLLEALNNLSSNKPLDAIITRLEEVGTKIGKLQEELKNVKDSLETGEIPDLTLLDNIKTLVNDISLISGEIYAKFDSEIAPKISKIFDDAFEVSQNILNVLNEAENKLPDIESILNTVYEGADKGINEIAFVKENLPEAENMISELTNKIGKVNDDESLKQLINLLKNNVQERTNFLSNPVNLIEKQLYPMGNYGTAMTPFYTILSFWVGLLLLSSILTVDVHGNYKSVEIYFGKLLLFITLALIQSMIVSLGDLYILKIYCLNPILFIIGSLFSSIVFAFIVYSACSVFGNVGKVIGIVLLVLQIGGSGGTFPIELTPKFFQRLNPLLPFTYAISFLRECIGGIVKEVLIKDIIALSVYIMISIIIGIVLKKPFSRIVNKFSNKFKESGIGEE